MKRKNTRGNKRGILLTLLMAVLFILMLGEVVTYVVVSINYNLLAQSAGAATNQGAAKTLIIQDADGLLRGGLTQSLLALNVFAGTPSVRNAIFLSGTINPIESVMTNGTLSGVNLARYIGAATLDNLSDEINAGIDQQGVTITLLGGKLNVFQNTSDALKATYSVLAVINTTTGSFTLPIFATGSIPLNGTPDILLSEELIGQTINFMHGYPTAIVVGGGTALAGTTSPFMLASGTAVVVTGSPSCSAIPARFLNTNFILVVQSAININSIACGMGGLVTNALPSSVPLVPYLVYPSNAEVFNVILNGTRVTVDGPELELLNMSPILYAIRNGFYYGSPFLPSYLNRIQGISATSPSGMFTFSGINRPAAYFTDSGGGTPTSNALVPAANAPVIRSNFTVSLWLYMKNEQYDCPGILSDTSSSNILLYVPTASGSCSAGSAPVHYSQLGFSYTDMTGAMHKLLSSPIETQSWTNVGIVFGANVVTFYVNGNIAGVLNGIINPNPSDGSLIIGAGSMAGNYSFNGSITNVQVYNSALPSLGMQMLYREGVAGAPYSNGSLSAWYPLIGNASDYGGFEHNGTASNVVYARMGGYAADPIYSSTYSQYNVSPVIGILNCGNPTECSNLTTQHLYIGDGPLSVSGTAVINESTTLGVAGAVLPRVLRFDAGTAAAPDYYVNESDTLAWLDSASQPFTFSIWIYPTAADGVIIDELQPGVGNRNDPFLSLAGGVLEVDYSGGTSCQSLGSIPLDTWTNVVFTFDGTQTLTGWVDGVETLTPTTNGARSAPSGPADYVLGGGSPSSGCATAHYNGLLSDFQVYNSALSASQAVQLYLNNSVSGLSANVFMPLSIPYLGNPNTTEELEQNNTGTFYANGVPCTVANAVIGACVRYVAP